MTEQIITTRTRNAPPDAIPFVFSDGDGNLSEGYVVDVHHGDTTTCIAWGGFDFVDGVEQVTGEAWDEEASRAVPDAEQVRIPAHTIDYIEVF